MSSSIDKKTYLQKYLGGPSKEKKKKKKKAVKGKGFKIIDDDLDLTKLRPLDGDELDVFDEGEDAPQIAGIIDERPEDVRKAEQFQSSSKWKVVNQDDGFNSKLQIQEIKRDVKEKEKENELIFGKMYSDSEDEQKNDSDLSPPRKNDSKNKDPSPPRRERNKSPNRERRKETKYDSDASPPRKREKSPKRRERSPINRRVNDSDQSPPRKRGKSPIERRKESKHDSNPSPPRKREQSPRNEVRRVRKSRWGNDEPQSEQRTSNGKTSSRNNVSNSPKLYQRNRSSDSDLSPPRKKDRTRISPDRNKRKHSDSDPSPPRRDREKSRSNVTDKSKNTQRHNKQRRYSSDLSPPRRKRDNSAENSRNRVRMSPKRDRNNRQSDSDQSPPRRNTERDRDTQNRTNERDKYNDSPPPSNKKMARTLEGKMAGLQNASQLREENNQFRQKEDEVFKKLADDVSGRNAKAVSRKGKRETSEERNKKKEKSERQKELGEKYKKWSRGVKQVEAQESRMQDYLHEASKPLARHRDDKDLESSLKQIDREGDPMLKYIKDKKRERGELGPEKPSYKGSFPPNRFNIRPGYRWDGVDRSNGYEKKFFEQQSKRKAQEEEAYKWSTEDL